ncbi:MAG: diguanylate cyclase [Acidobacteria bacterium]|nr:diguanylate cyclase [Acidobacteriota bacterium]
MDPATLELQIFVSLIVILATAFVALVCDYLKGNNERLREHNIELRVREEEHDRQPPMEAIEWLQHLMAVARTRPARRVPPKRAPVAQPIHAKEAAAAAPPDASTPAEAKPEQTEQTEAASKPSDSVPMAPPVVRLPRAMELGRVRRADTSGGNQLLETLPKPAWLVKELEEKAVARALLESKKPVALVPVAAESIPQPMTPPEQIPEAQPASDVVIAGLLEQVVEATASSAQPESQIEQASQVAESQPPLAEAVVETVQLAESNAQETMAQISTVAIEMPSRPLEEASADPDLASAFRTVHSALPQLQLPPGYQDSRVLAELLNSTDVLSGVVVSVGINDYGKHLERLDAHVRRELTEKVDGLIRSMLGEKDFGCRSNEDEFLLVFPGETGPDAQRRLSMISERLWSFQLRSLSSFSVMFSWGAVEVHGETLADATASASERMYQTKRSRKGAPADAPNKVAVNQ